ncbi:2OG-Fe(II) oxygenase superfamily protein [Rhexocercosporidium sp. MPI-PUGE-AT-0058]|nr:2OG-Fe(II) oxygenase superfamily protein [Rhexocercosporidium sp. MPI-PUGE-AT-0058]
MSQTQVQTPTSNSVPLYTQVPETSHELDWADLATLDLSAFDATGGKQALASQLKNAIEQIGFFYIINFGLDQNEVDRQFAIGKEFFNLDIEEKLKYRADLENGGYNGYKPIGLREIAPGYFDNTEIYNIPKFIPRYERAHPTLINENWAEISKFGRYIHKEVVSKLLVLFAILLELPEDFFLKTHRYSEKSDCHLRYMKYHARTPEVNQAINNVWVKGHTDFGSLTLLFRQPVAALQVRTPQETWKYVKPYPGSITVNIADSLSFLTNGYLRSSIHRVVAPPPDQAHLDRLGVLYFVRPEDDLELKTISSPLLGRLGLDKQADGPVLTAGEWVKARVAKNVSRAGDSTKENGEQEIIKGVSAKYYD